MSVTRWWCSSRRTPFTLSPKRTFSNAIAMRPGGAIRESNPGLRKRGLQCGERLRPRDAVRDEPLCLLEPLDRALGRRPVRAVDCAGAVADALERALELFDRRA